MSPQDIKSAFQREARALGFEICRMTSAAPPPHAAEFRAWLGDGWHGDMAWLEKNAHRRTNPEAVLPGVRTIIVLAMNYWQPAPAGGEGAGKIARYAWGEDYHEVIEPRLYLLDTWLQQHGGRQRQYVDTGPVLERDVAAQAGVGWQGKSAMLIHPKLGTYTFLAAILTTLDLPPDPPMQDHCGKCARCITACPTAAIVEPRRVDARRCISYLTIENKGAIPEAMRPLIGNRIYGCDDCLEACPWNRFAVASNETRFAAREFVGMRLRDFLALDNDAFRSLFRKSPIKRIKRRGFLRNVCVALGNVGTADDLPALHAAACDPEPLIAEHAAWAIGMIEGRSRGQKSAVGSQKSDTASDDSRR
jgi:epoxyqueuosine reductase